MPELRLAKARLGYEDYEYAPPRRRRPILTPNEEGSHLVPAPRQDWAVLQDWERQ